MMAGGEQKELQDFLKKYERLVRARVHVFLSRKPQRVADWLREDLQQAARGGVVCAYRTFDASRGVPEAAYVSLQIGYAIAREFDIISPVPARDIAKISRLLADKALLERLFCRPVSNRELADFLSVREAAVEECLQLFVECAESAEGGDFVQTMLADEGLSVEEEVCRKEVREDIAAAVSELAPREREIFFLLFVRGMTLEAVGSRFGTSKQSIAKTRDRLLARIRRSLEKKGYSVFQGA